MVTGLLAVTPHRCRNGGAGLARSGAGPFPSHLNKHGLNKDGLNKHGLNPRGPNKSASARGCDARRAPHPKPRTRNALKNCAGSVLARNGTNKR